MILHYLNRKSKVNINCTKISINVDDRMLKQMTIAFQTQIAPSNGLTLLILSGVVSERFNN